MSSEYSESEVYKNRLRRLQNIIGQDPPPKILAAECILIAKAACEMGQVPVDLQKAAQALIAMIDAECAKPEVKAQIARVEEEVKAMGEEVHSEGCPAYDMWIKMSMPAAPGECTCGGSKTGKRR